MPAICILTAPNCINTHPLVVCHSSGIWNAENFREAISGATSSRPVFVSMTDGTYTAGLAACELADKSIVGSWGKTAGETYNNLYTLAALSGFAALTSLNIDCGKVTAAALIFTDIMEYNSQCYGFYCNKYKPYCSRAYHRHAFLAGFCRFGSSPPAQISIFKELKTKPLP